MKNLIMFLASVLLLAAAPAQASGTEVAFYNEPAQWLFDILHNPTKIRNGTMIDDGIEVGFTQYSYCDPASPTGRCLRILECSAHGKTIANPTSSSDSQLVLCNITADFSSIIFPPNGGGSVSFSGDNGSAAQIIYSFLPNIGAPLKDKFNHSTRTNKYLGTPGLDGISCYMTVPDDASKPSHYDCGISWKASLQR